MNAANETLNGNIDTLKVCFTLMKLFNFPLISFCYGFVRKRIRAMNIVLNLIIEECEVVCKNMLMRNWVPAVRNNINEDAQPQFYSR